MKNYKSKGLIFWMGIAIVALVVLFLVMLKVNKVNEPVFINTDSVFIAKPLHMTYKVDDKLPVVLTAGKYTRGLPEHQGLYDDISTQGKTEDKIQSSGKTYDFTDTSKRKEIMDDILGICINGRSPKVCDILYADLLIRTGKIPATSDEVSYALDQDLKLYVETSYDDERDLAASITEYVDVLDKITGIGLKEAQKNCGVIAEALILMKANNEGVDIYTDEQMELMKKWRSQACIVGAGTDIRVVDFYKLLPPEPEE